MIGSVMALPIPENEWTAGLSSENRLGLTVDTVIVLLRRFVRSRNAPLILILEDVQWMDQASWTIVLGVLAGMPEILVLVSSRLVPAGANPSLDLLSSRPETQRLHLLPLPPKAILWLIRNRLGVQELPPSAEDFLSTGLKGTRFSASSWHSRSATRASW